MAAVQVNTTTGALLAGTNTGYETVLIQNLGPNAIAVEIGAPAVLATSINVAATTGTVTIKRPPGTAINAIAATALQVSPADTRVAVVG